MLCLFQFLLEDEVIDNTHDNAEHGCTGRRKADLGQTGIWLNALIAGKLETAVLGTHVVGDFGTGTSADTSVRPKLYKHMY